ncbi:S-layer domain containing protein [Clostridium aceticum]|uniref:S-layer domain containing protein n=1 Tax=Clostridium aceticum TaxID=84022 RepID=A0A0D8IEB3_9CLOT|nr:S-layer homology domain-containing protein [Clostridium aceticum]AKL94364.1 S-layer domain containing protein [Clostridium aceticum]KJF28404.1 hypothetical protein TZ02_03310 [Clostridium aceticum]
MTKRFIAAIMMILFITTVFSNVVFAVETSVYTKTQIEVLVREKLSINDSMKLNQANLTTRDLQQKKMWNLEFQNEKEGIFVTVGADTGEIMNLHRWGDSTYGKAVTVLPENAKRKAIDFIQSLEPERFKETEEVVAEAPSAIVYSIGRDIYGGENYHFLFLRKLEGEFFPNNYFRVQISGVDGNVTSYEMKWDEAFYNNEKSLITKEEARKIFEGEDRFTLKYVALYHNNKDERRKPLLTPVYLYAPKKSDLIHAVDGRLLEAEEIYYHDYYLRTTTQDMGAKEMAVGRAGAEVLPEEGVISKEKAEKLVGEALSRELDMKELRVQSSYYSQYHYGIKGKFWGIYWVDEETGRRLHATLDAEKGEIISISYSKDPIGIFRAKELEKLQETSVDETRIKQEINKKVKDIFPHIQEEELQFEIKSVEGEGLVAITSSRYIHAIPYEENYLRITYDATTKKIIGLDYNWYEVELQATSNILDKKTISNKFYDTVGFEKYLIQLKDQAARKKDGLDIPLKQLAPVYSLKVFHFTYIDAVSGKFLNYNGEEYIEKDHSIEGFKDVKNSPYQSEILLMNKMGILKETSELFRPNDVLLRKDAIKWIVEVNDRNRYGIDKKAVHFKDVDKEDPYYSYIQTALEKEIIEKTNDYFRPDETATKMEVTQWILNALQQKELAQFVEIFQIPYTDAEDIRVEDTGYVALAKYYNIFRDKGRVTTFNPEKVLSRGEFVSVLYHLLKDKL